MDNITIVFCEGMHDINFLSKILYVHGYKDYKEKLKEFQEPLGALFLNILKEEKDLEARKIGFNPIYKVPSVALHHEENEELVLFYNMGGDNRDTERKEVLNMYQKLLSEEDDFSPSNFNFKFLYFFDADDSPKENRIDNLNTELVLTLEHLTILEHEGYKWGCYIFHKDNKGGCLEDILLDLMKPTNETIFNNAEKFISNNILTENNRQCEYKPTDGTYKTQQKFKNKKSIISVAGQLQFSGMANAVIIGKSDYITKADIENSSVCQDIMKLFT